MKISDVFFILCIVAINVNAEEIFRYNDEETGQSHFMEGDPGTTVNGGWKFLAPEGDNYELNYIADVNGFQPKAGYLPVHVDDTEDVKKAKVQFYKMFEETDSKLKIKEPSAEPLTVPLGVPSYYAPFSGYFPRNMDPKMKKSEDDVKKVQMQMKDIHEKYMKTRKAQLEKLSKHSPHYYSHFYYYPQHLLPDMKLSEDEIQKIHADMKEADETYMKDMKEQTDILAEDFPYYPNFYPPITNFPVKHSNDVDSKVEEMETPMLPKLGPLYTFPPYYTYSHKNVEENAEVKEVMEDKGEHIFPKHFTYSPYFYRYGFPNYVKPEVTNDKIQVVVDKENSRRRRDVVEPALAYATYPRFISHSYYPTNAFYYPRLVPSMSYHPTVAQVTRTIVKLPETVIGNTVEGGDNVNVVNSEETVVGSDGVELDSGAEAESEDSGEHVEPEVEPEVVPEVEPETEPVLSNEVTETDTKLTQIRPVGIQRPIYYPSFIQPGVAAARPAFHPNWGTRWTFVPFQGGYGGGGYTREAPKIVDTKAGQNVIPFSKFSTFPVKEKDMKLAAIVA